MFTDPAYLFTYGTLTQGFENPFAKRLRAHSIFEGRGSLPGRLYRIEWYPGAVYDELGKARIYGEVYRLLSPDIIIELDAYEDVFEDEATSLYVRKTVPVLMENAAVIQCWAYLYNQPVDEANLIPGGYFLR